MSDARNTISPAPHVVSIRQVDRATRYLALDDADYQSVRRDWSRVDGVSPLAIADVSFDGCVRWVRRDDASGVAAIREHLEWLGQEAE